MQLSLFVSVWNTEEVLNSALFSCMIIYSKYIEYKISQTLTYTLVSMSAFLPDVYTSGFLHFTLSCVQIIIGLHYVSAQICISFPISYFMMIALFYPRQVSKLFKSLYGNRICGVIISLRNSCYHLLFPLANSHHFPKIEIHS